MYNYLKKQQNSAAADIQSSLNFTCCFTISGFTSDSLSEKLLFLVLYLAFILTCEIRTAGKALLKHQNIFLYPKV